MNAHLLREAPRSETLPERMYARLDHVELAADAMTVLLAFDAVDADWLDGEMRRGNPAFQATDTDQLASAWRQALQETPPQSPLEHAPLYRIEVEQSARRDVFGIHEPTYEDTGRPGSGLARLEWPWIELLRVNADTPGAQEAALYDSLFANPVSIHVKGSLPDPSIARNLSASFSPEHLPAMSIHDLEVLLARGIADRLAAYDVGQGNANALLSDRPTLYFDLGAGVYRNRHTTPAHLEFCFTNTPPIVLSHWDADHWAGAYITRSGSYPALRMNWAAPLQEVGPLHLAFACDVIAHGGTFAVLKLAAGTIASAPLGPDIDLRLAVGHGSCRNNSGIVMAVENKASPGGRSWLLTGDCDYSFIDRNLMQATPVAIVAPHHGATLHRHTHVPASVIGPGGYCRLIYSFGPNNAHGTRNTSHPTAQGVASHAAAGWRHAPAWAGAPGSVPAGHDTLATAEHGTGTGGQHLGSIVVGWDAAPALAAPPCGGQCTLTLVQT